MASNLPMKWPGEGEVELVFQPLPSTLQPHHWAGLVADEQARAARFAFERDRARFACGRARLRELLGLRLSLPPLSVPLATGPQGKPVLATASPWQFNLSHSGGLALYAFAQGAALGVDLEAVQPTRNLEGLARTVFSTAEQAQWQALPDADKPLAFTTLWARKEAVLKALGTGLTLEPARLHLGLSNAAQALTLSLPEYTGPVHVHPVPAGPGFAAALASLQPVRRLHLPAPEPFLLEAAA